jgi:hypothetical protein
MKKLKQHISAFRTNVRLRTIAFCHSRFTQGSLSLLERYALIFLLFSCCQVNISLNSPVSRSISLSTAQAITFITENPASGRSPEIKAAKVLVNSLQTPKQFSFLPDYPGNIPSRIISNISFSHSGISPFSLIKDDRRVPDIYLKISPLWAQGPPCRASLKTNSLLPQEIKLFLTPTKRYSLPLYFTFLTYNNTKWLYRLRALANLFPHVFKLPFGLSKSWPRGLVPGTLPYLIVLFMSINLGRIRQGIVGIYVCQRFLLNKESKLASIELFAKINGLQKKYKDINQVTQGVACVIKGWIG